MGKLSTAEVLRLRATSAVSRDQSVRRSAQDDDFVGVLTKNKLALIGHGPGLTAPNQRIVYFRDFLSGPNSGYRLPVARPMLRQLAHHRAAHPIGILDRLCTAGVVARCLGLEKIRSRHALGWDREVAAGSQIKCAC